MKQWRETKTPSPIMIMAEDSAKRACVIDSEYYNTYRGSRRSEIIAVQRIACLLLRRKVIFGLEAIASFFGVSHATICHHVKTCQNIIDVDKNFKKLYTQASDFFDQGLAEMTDNN